MVMSNQYISVMWNILKIIKVLMRKLYLVLSPLMLVKIILIEKVINMFLEEVTSKITIDPLRCMFTVHNIKSKIYEC